MATVRPDGTPVTVACWYEYRPGGRVLLSMSDTAQRLDHLRRDPRVALTILGEDWYQHVSLLGRVVETHVDEGLADLDRISMHYRGTPYPSRLQGVTVEVEVERWHTYGSPAAGAQPAG
jgi:PPOX class probable F420-dependent enzyme